MPDSYRRILGIRFFTGTMAGLLDATANGGLIVVPSAPVLTDLHTDEAHRTAVEGADFAITDSGFMVLFWLLIEREKLPRISGLRYLRALLDDPRFREKGATFWVMPSREEAETNARWLNNRGVPVDESDWHVAPRYGRGPLEDAELLTKVQARRPRYIVLCIAGGVQERLGFFLRNNLPYRPAIICTGAAIGFLSGNQVGIPAWADRLVLGWLFRLFANPKGFAPKFRRAFGMFPLLLRHRENSVTASGGRNPG